MPETIKIELHCHSSFSDGEWDPEIIAEYCAATGVKYAALTDHNTLAGLDRFEASCDRHGVGFITGLEITALHNHKEIHLLCFGFDRTNASLVRAVTALREAHMHNTPTYTIAERKSLPGFIESVHHAGGIVFMAHPLVTEPDLGKLKTLLVELRQAGMDGIEVYHSPSSAEQQRLLAELAAEEDWVASGGTDHHGQLETLESTLGVEFPLDEWRSLRDLLIKRRREAGSKATSAEVNPKLPPRVNSHSGRMTMLLWMVLPALAAVILFSLTLFGFFLPSFETALIDRKREMIRELTNTVWSLLDEAEKEIQSGRISSADAQKQVAETVRSLRYGHDGKDYFWLQDLTPRMIMHPFRNDLEDQNLSDFKNPEGIRIFSVFADKVRKEREGYVDYVWQWKDDPTRLEAKESYIRLFEPWGWVIGTGLYIHDVENEITILERRLIFAMCLIVVALILLLLVMLRGGLRIEQMRLAAERHLQESHERYLSLARAAAEGVLFVRNSRCAYANPVFLELAGCEAEDLPLLDWHDLFPETSAQDQFFVDTGNEIYTDAIMKRRDGNDLKCRIALKGTQGKEHEGFVVLVRRSEDAWGKSTSPAGGLLKRLLNLPAASAEDIAREIAKAETAEEVVSLCRRTPKLVRTMLESGASPTGITSMISSITDSATTKFIDLAQANLGAAPVPFAFIAMGSQGRMEQTLSTDQDNAIVYDLKGNESVPDSEHYFGALAARVCENLEKSGYRDCKGLFMAKNLKWCQPLNSWKDSFTKWISKAEELDMIEFGTFFDFRCVKGDENLIQNLRSHIQREIVRSPWFLTQVARSAVTFKSPLRIFGNIVSAGSSKEKTGHLDLKAVMMPIVCFARLYSLQKQVAFTSTTERLFALSDMGIFLPSQHHDIVTAFESMLRLRLRHQSETIERGEEPDNLIDPSRLGHIDEAVLKECFNEIDRIQKKIGWDFLGGEDRI